ncbi:hypothetical protein WICPIJ_006151 [Wickerhamomyces pijperi]|uniref:Uncharacterized protein n=1 Tax=Wickerhamomyces pijperi TaxID=599730 RepID=A0A9P8TLB0_WICPI|nr:hypothetical protein WICPIJ_006151 [Wickerhamomyces pijperi]
MSLRRKLQQRRDGRFSVNKPSSINNNNTDHSVLIKWKHKQGIDLTCEILQSIMSVFGPVASVNTIPSSSSSEKYQSSIVTFSDEQGYLKALSYDLDRDRSKLWENTSYRKLSGLLREIKEARRSDLYEVMIETLDRLKDYRSLS